MSRRQRTCRPSWTTPAHEQAAPSAEARDFTGRGERARLAQETLHGLAIVENNGADAEGRGYVSDEPAEAILRHVRPFVAVAQHFRQALQIVFHHHRLHGFARLVRVVAAIAKIDHQVADL